MDGNIYAVLGAARNAMRKSKVERGVIQDMCDRVSRAASYHAALGVIMEYVDFDL